MKIFSGCFWSLKLSLIVVIIDGDRNDGITPVHTAINVLLPPLPDVN